MSSVTKKQHYVPRFLLRKFADPEGSERVNVLRLKPLASYPRSNIKDVAHENHFYGEQAVESALGKFETPAGAVIGNIIATHTLPPVESPDYVELLMFTVLQTYRTPDAADSTSADFDRIAKAQLANAAEAREFHDSLDDFRFVPDNPPAWAISMGLYSVPLLFDLDAVLLINTSAVPFILSDHPAVRYNRWLEVHGAPPSVGGLLSRGLQMFLPLAPRLAVVLYDRDVYNFGPQNAGAPVVPIDDRDVNQLNILQASAARGAVFFDGQITDKSVRELITSGSKFRSDGFPKDVLQTGLSLRCVQFTELAQRLVPRSPIDLMRDADSPVILDRFHAALKEGKVKMVDLGSFYRSEKERIEQIRATEAAPK